MNPNDLEWLKEQKHYPKEKRLINLNVEQSNRVLQPDQPAQPVQPNQPVNQPAQPDQEESGITRTEDVPRRVYRLFLDFLKRTLNITRRGSIFEFHVANGEDYTIIIDEDMMYVTSDTIEQVKSDLGISEENVMFTRGKMTHYPTSGITQLVLQGVNSEMILQYQPNQGITVYIEIGGEIITINGKIIGGIRNE